MTAIPQTLLDPSLSAHEPAPDTVLRRLRGSGRVMIGGGVLGLIVLACLLTLPLTLSETIGKGPAAQSNDFYYNQQHPTLTRQTPGLFTDDARPGLSGPDSPFRRPWNWLGTDALGRSLFSRSLLGGTISLTIGLAAATISVFLGVTIGLIAGYRGGWIDTLLMRSVDILYGLPYILLIILLKIALEPVLGGFSIFRGVAVFLAIALVAFTLIIQLRGGPGIGTVLESVLYAGRTSALGWSQVSRLSVYATTYTAAAVLLVLAEKQPRWHYGFQPATANLIVLFLAIGMVSWLTMARVIRGQVLSLRAQPFIESCRAGGLTEWRVFTRHLLPNLIGPITVYATLTVPQAILEESFLSFLGIGIQRPVPTWGSLASDGLMPTLDPIHHYWYMLVIPCLLLSITLLSLNFLGDGLRDVFDPKRDAAKA